ncbi:MAG: class I SAM-dependent methyltransferase [Candidatus Moraniibacteriota bacterium]|nr:MAG: class I SAM-dependent methyltransferase [Candidatus Moranbacteria bacterium]
MNQTEFHKHSATFSNGNSFEKIRRLLDFLGDEPLDILDVGCGASPTLHKTLRTLGHRITGLDIFPASPTSQHSKILESDINETWPVPKDSFDLVLCTDVPEHLYDPTHILREGKRVLRKDGSIIFGVPNHFDLRQRLRMLSGGGIIHWDHVRYGESGWNYAHIRFFTLQELLHGFREHEWFVRAAQFNFMGGGIFPTRFTPRFFRRFLLTRFPNLFSGKFLFLLQKEPLRSQKITWISLDKTPKGV